VCEWRPTGREIDSGASARLRECSTVILDGFYPRAKLADRSGKGTVGEPTFALFDECCRVEWLAWSNTSERRLCRSYRCGKLAFYELRCMFDGKPALYVSYAFIDRCGRGNPLTEEPSGSWPPVGGMSPLIGAPF
jgi:hypothetical protein